MLMIKTYIFKPTMTLNTLTTNSVLGKPTAISTANTTRICLSLRTRRRQRQSDPTAARAIPLHSVALHAKQCLTEKNLAKNQRPS